MFDLAQQFHLRECPAGLCLGVQETFCAGGDIKGWGCSLVSWAMGGVVLVCTSKATRRASKNSGLSYKLQVSFTNGFFTIGAPVLGLFVVVVVVAFCPAADISLQAGTQ